MSRPRGRFARSKARQGDSLRHQTAKIGPDLRLLARSCFALGPRTIALRVHCHATRSKARLVSKSTLTILISVKRWYSDLLLRLWGPWVFDVIECLDNFLCFSLSSRTSPFRKHSVLFFSVGLPRAVCAFVSLTRDKWLKDINILTRSSKRRGQMLSKLLLTAASKSFGSNDIQIIPHWIIHST